MPQMISSRLAITLALALNAAPGLAAPLDPDVACAAAPTKCAVELVSSAPMGVSLDRLVKLAIGHVAASIRLAPKADDVDVIRYDMPGGDVVFRLGGVVVALPDPDAVSLTKLWLDVPTMPSVCFDRLIWQAAACPSSPALPVGDVIFPPIPE